jgi:hypothetical protein
MESCKQFFDFFSQDHITIDADNKTDEEICKEIFNTVTKQYGQQAPFGYYEEFYSYPPYGVETRVSFLILEKTHDEDRARKIIYKYGKIWTSFLNPTLLV